MLTSLSLDGLRSKFARALGIAEARVERNIVAGDPLSITLNADLGSVKGPAIVKLQELADTLKFEVQIDPHPEKQLVQVELSGKIQAAFYHETAEQG